LPGWGCDSVRSALLRRYRRCDGGAERLLTTEGPVTGAMALAGRHAAVPSAGKRAVGNPDGSADETDSARAALPLPGTPGRPARIYQENAGDAG